jgi:hypothetical protein
MTMYCNLKQVRALPLLFDEGTRGPATCRSARHCLARCQQVRVLLKPITLDLA